MICLSTQLSALMGLTSQSTPKQMTEMVVIGRLLLDMVSQVSTTEDREMYLSIKGNVHHALGTMARSEVTPEGDKRMISHFESYLEVTEELGYTLVTSSSKAKRTDNAFSISDKSSSDKGRFSATTLVLLMSVANFAKHTKILSM